MFSVRLKNDLLEIKSEAYMGASEFRMANEYLKSIPGSYFNEEKKVWLVSKSFVDDIDKNLGERTAWHNSIEDIKGISEVILPQFTIDAESLHDMKLQPFPFQVVGISFLHDIKCGLLADEMGLGS